MMMRQGDLLILKIDAIPKGAVQLNHRVLAEGEATGHTHELDTGELYEDNGTLYFRVTEEAKEATLNHPEHGPLTFEEGTYQVIRQREYNPRAWESWTYVAD
jgi:hypothetical protein